MENRAGSDTEEDRNDTHAFVRGLVILALALVSVVGVVVFFLIVAVLPEVAPGVEERVHVQFEIELKSQKALDTLGDNRNNEAVRNEVAREIENIFSSLYSSFQLEA